MGKQVTFGPELVVGGDLLTPKAKVGGRKEGVKYKLFGGKFFHCGACRRLNLIPSLQ